MTILWTLFVEFCKIGVFCVGGGYASMPLIQAAVVDGYHWIDLPTFINIFTISQMTPGPIGINAATFVGQKIFGIPGSIAATVGFVFPSFIIGILLAKLVLKYGSIGPVRGILNGLRPAVVALICVASFSFLWLAIWDMESMPETLDQWTSISWGGLIITIGAIIACRVKIGVIKILIASGVAGLLLGYIGLI